MHPRHGIIVALAAGTSLLLHAAVLSSFRSVRVGTGSGPAEVGRFEEMTIHLVRPESEQAAEPRPEPKSSEFEIGEVGADGYASHKAPGDHAAVSREAPVDQAALSLDPVGTLFRPETPSTEAGDAAADLVGPLIALAPPPAAAAPPALLPIRVGPPPDVVRPAAPTAPPLPDAGASTVTAIETPAVPAPADGFIAAAVTAPPAPPAPEPATPARAGGAGEGADPAPMSDSESDAFSVLGSARFVNGELRVRAGRKVRSRRPKIGLAGQVDAVYSRVEVTLRVAVDKTGKVTAVEVAKSSGSNQIDQPCRVSMYDWWFEPKKDAGGNPVPDVFDFTIGFQ